MGASGWSYFVPFDRDHGRALRRLQKKVFASGKFYRRPRSPKPKTLAELRKLSGEDGTHSILDMNRVIPPPKRPGEIQSSFDEQRFGSVSELHATDLTEFFGTTKPTRAQVEDRLDEITSWRNRNVGSLVVIYKDGKPDELLFTGFSGD
jgi:hypothetical protein